MRLFDKAISQCESDEGRLLLKSDPPIVLCVDVIAEHYATHSQAFWGPDDYPYASPPWDQCFVEWNQPAIWKVETGAPLDGIPIESGLFKSPEAAQVGMLFTRVARADLVQVRAMLRLHGVADVNSDSILRGLFFLASRGRTVMLSVVGFYFLSAEGSVLHRAIMGPGIEIAQKANQAASVQRMLDSNSHIAFLAFTFANCSNVKLEDHTDELQPSRKIMRRLKLPEVKRYTLNIAGHTARPSRDYHEGPSGVIPFHLCRGHFATYTAERPMFGNPKLVGRYWHPPHTKGKKERGEIVKDYAIQD